MPRLFHLVLYHPEIAPNTGACMRLAANTGSHLHLIEPLGFKLDDAKLRRAGMDYRDRAVVAVHADLDTFQAVVAPTRTYAFSNLGSTRYTDVAYRPGDALLFGPESVGLPEEVMQARTIEAVLHLPMQPDVRSLNLANAVAIAAYEAWRQNDFR